MGFGTPSGRKFPFPCENCGRPVDGSSIADVDLGSYDRYVAQCFCECGQEYWARKSRSIFDIHMKSPAIVAAPIQLSTNIPVVAAPIWSST